MTTVEAMPETQHMESETVPVEIEPTPIPLSPSVEADGVMGNLDIGDATKCLRLDPRNNLPLVTVPQGLEMTAGIDWNASIIYWFGVVDRCTQWWRKERRIIFLGDDNLYVAYPGSVITRCLPIKGIKSILVSHDQRWINILMNEEHDLRFACMEPCTASREGKSVQAFLGAIATVWRGMHQKPLPTYRMPASTNFKQILNLSKSWRWSHPPVTAPRPRSALFNHLVTTKRQSMKTPGAMGYSGTQSMPGKQYSFDRPISEPGAYGSLPASTVRPPVSAHTVSARSWAPEPFESMPLSARRPPVRAPFFESPASMKKAERPLQYPEDRDEDAQMDKREHLEVESDVGEADSDASGIQSSRDGENMTSPQPLHFGGDSLGTTPISEPTTDKKKKKSNLAVETPDRVKANETVEEPPRRSVAKSLEPALTDSHLTAPAAPVERIPTPEGPPVVIAPRPSSIEVTRQPQPGPSAPPAANASPAPAPSAAPAKKPFAFPAVSAR